MEHYHEANELMVEEEYEDALVCYDKALKEVTDNAEIYIKRSICNYKLGKYLDAMEDAGEALNLESENAKAYFRKGLALFALEEYEGAMDEFQAGKDKNEKGFKWDRWIRKCQAELDAEAEEDQDAEQHAKKPKVEEKNVEVTNDVIEKDEVKAEKKEPEPEAPKGPPVKYEWYQTDQDVVVTIFCKGLDPQDFKVSFNYDSLACSIKVDGEEYWALNANLLAEIIPEHCQISRSKYKLEVSLRKKLATRWPTLERAAGEEIVQAPQPPPSKLVTPYATKKKINWDKYLAEQDDLDDDDPLNKVFKDIYGKGSDEQRRAMMKSYQESGGTVLSTNWDEIGKKKTEISPPTGMEARSWNPHDPIPTKEDDE